MTDGLGLFDNSRSQDRHDDEYDYDDEPRKPRGKKRRSPTFWVVAVVVVAIIAGGAWYGVTQVLGIGGFDDYTGAGETDVVVEVKAGQGTADIGAALKAKDVVASSRAFTSAGEDQPKVKAVQPGFYLMKTKMSGKAAADRIVSKDARVGNLQIRAGTQLDDIKLPGDKTTPGVFTLIANAGRVTMNGKETGPTVEELRKVAETVDLKDLGAPAWAVPFASQVEPKRRLEGLITPGVYDVEPGVSAQELLTKVVKDSATTLDGWGMPKLAEKTGYTPYQVLVMGSLIEREGIAKDFDKISRVIYRRLADNIRLGFDSTINYVLDRPTITTDSSARESQNPYNTYKNFGLTPTPIAATSKAALQAAAKPADGPWVYFVKCEKDGTSCFAETQGQHDQNVRDARARDVY
ncbi:endolytic transglycosylase MltG [Kibdelosporangium philippinense]|uniref:Endolytic murein transglycosylase n=1 Tax=Kibdelosporangium philippinense TaxID=211113 RepID=A0ABS8ZSA7_9PSEU|nr:endolytic transglycosylase MltG [Kibdelosporangium philippinense]MCE7010562.1 endolytic transglycosylase MltG [Kibdelosporangium philippinense]